MWVSWCTNRQTGCWSRPTSRRSGFTRVHLSTISHTLGPFPLCLLSDFTENNLKIHQQYKIQGLVNVNDKLSFPSEDITPPASIMDCHDLNSPLYFFLFVVFHSGILILAPGAPFHNIVQRPYYACFLKLSAAGKDKLSVI